MENLTRFQQFHMDNPHVFAMWEKITFEAMRRGFLHCGAALIRELIRWETSIETTGTEYKMPNDFTPHYARLFMKEHPEHEGFFRTRTAAADEDPELATEPTMPNNKCRSCNAEIIWLKKHDKITGETSEKATPIDEVKHPKGNLVIDREKGLYRFATGNETDIAKYNGKGLHISHFATCPDSDSFRKPKTGE